MQRYRIVVASLIAFLLTACNASNSNSGSTVAAPVFTTTPGTQAVEGSPYSYQVAASGTGVTFALSSAPTGATLSGNTVSWTPTTQESRTANSFTVTATASGGASSTQSWTVTPSGTVTDSDINTVWNESGSTQQPYNWAPISSSVVALVPQPDDSFQSLSGAVGSDGTFDIPNVPAGYYWLRIGPEGTYWTSSSTFDIGTDTFEPVLLSSTSSVSTTEFTLAFTSLDPTPSVLAFNAFGYGLSFARSTTPGSTTLGAQLAESNDIDYSGITIGFARQYEQAALGSTSGYVLGPELTLSNLSFTNGAQNTIGGALNPTVPASVDLSVKGSAWTSLFTNSAPTAVTPLEGGFNLFVLPYVSANAPNLEDIFPIDLVYSGTTPNVAGSSCSGIPTLTTDVDTGTLQYSDPFPSTWRRIFRMCQAVSVATQISGTQNIILVDTQTTSLPRGQSHRWCQQCKTRRSTGPASSPPRQSKAQRSHSAGIRLRLAHRSVIRSRSRARQAG